jgi:CheY-like chemotaxis protein
MDIQMPQMDGLEAIRRIRADPELQAIPVVAVTALAMAGDAERCLAAGANAYLSKPVRLKELVATIEAHRR